MSFSFNRVKSFHNLSTNMKYSVRLRSTKPNVETKTLYPQINAEIRILSGSKKSRELRKCKFHYNFVLLVKLTNDNI